MVTLWSSSSGIGHVIPLKAKSVQKNYTQRCVTSTNGDYKIFLEIQKILLNHQVIYSNVEIILFHSDTNLSPHRHCEID